MKDGQQHESPQVGEQPAPFRQIRSLTPMWSRKEEECVRGSDLHAVLLSVVSGDREEATIRRRVVQR